MSAIHKIVYSCEEATLLMVKKSSGKVSFLQKLRLRMHLLMCSACKRFDIQNQWIDEQIHKLGNVDHGAHLSPEQREKLEGTLKKEISNS